LFRKEEYADGDVIHIDLAQEVSFLNKAAIKQTLSQIPENSKVIIDATDTVYIAHDILDLIHEFKTTRALDNNIKVKLKGFKKAYQLENTIDSQNHVTIEHYYDAAKRVMVKRVVTDDDFLKEEKTSN
jgi:MFS superfamily sulfate permease-like transporter